MVAPAGSSTDKGVGATEMVDTVADTGPGVKVTLTALAKVTLPVVSVAVSVLVSAFVDFILAVV